MIYFLEDDPSIRKLVIYTLNSQGMSVHVLQSTRLSYGKKEV